MAGGDASSDPTQHYVDALKHPMRREILHLAVGSSEALSPVRASRTLDEHLSNVSYHVKVLVECGLMRPAHTRRTRGAVEHFYVIEPRALAHPVVKAFLGRSGCCSDG
jgi:DNA-binding transcriptional ArsR family regulator